MEQFVFFSFLNEYLRREIDYYSWELLGRFTTFATTVALTLLTLWILFQGYMIVSGRSRQNLMGLVVDSLRNVLIVGLATSMALGGSELYWRLTDGLGATIVSAVADEAEPYEKIDQNLLIMTGAFAAIEMLPALENAQDPQVEKAKDRALLFTGVGIAGPRWWPRRCC